MRRTYILILCGLFMFGCNSNEIRSYNKEELYDSPICKIYKVENFKVVQLVSNKDNVYENYVYDTLNNNIVTKGCTLGNHRIGDWIEYDSIGNLKSIKNYFNMDTINHLNYMYSFKGGKLDSTNSFFVKINNSCFDNGLVEFNYQYDGYNDSIVVKKTPKNRYYTYDELQTVLSKVDYEKKIIFMKKNDLSSVYGLKFFFFKKVSIGGYEIMEIYLENVYSD